MVGRAYLCGSSVHVASLLLLTLLCLARSGLGDLMVSEHELDKVRAHLKQVKAPSVHDKVHKVGFLELPASASWMHFPPITSGSRQQRDLVHDT